MKDYELLDAVGGIDPEYIEEANRKVPKSKAVWRKALLPAAACLGIVIGAAVLLSKVPFSSLKPNAGNDADAGAGVGSADPGGMLVDGVDPVIASVAVLPDFEELKDVEAATLTELTEDEMASATELTNYLPGTIPKDYTFKTASMYKTTMKNGTVYEMLRVHYSNAQSSESPETILSGEDVVVSVWSFLPATSKPVYTIENIPQQLEDEMFYVQLKDVYVSVQAYDLASEELLSVVKEIAAAGGEEEGAADGDYPASIMVNGKIYQMAYITINEEIDESQIIGYTESYTDGRPKQDGETNFNREPGMPYAEVEDGIAVFYENAWQLFTLNE